MAKKKLERVHRKLTPEEKARHKKVREQVAKEFPPKKKRRRKPAPAGLPSQIRAAREAQGLTYYAVAKMADIPHSGTIRDVEEGRDTKVSTMEAIARALGMELALVEA